jgi:hypothetical protein
MDVLMVQVGILLVLLEDFPVEFCLLLCEDVYLMRIDAFALNFTDQLFISFFFGQAKIFDAHLKKF